MKGPVYVGTFPPGSDEWLAARVRGIGGSEVAAVLGISPFESRFSLYHRKAGNIGPVPQSPEMRAGTVLEQSIRQVFREDHPDIEINEVGTWRHRDREWQIANPDGLGDGCIWEGKYSLYGYGYGEPGSDEIPVYHRSQVLHYLDVFGLPLAHLTVFIGATAEFRHHRIRYDADEAAFQRRECEKFLADVAAGRTPDIDGHDATYEAVRELHPDIDPETVQLDDALASHYLEALAQYRNAAEQKRRMSALVVTAMGRAQHAEWRGDRIASRLPPKSDTGHPYLRAANGAADLHREAAHA